MKTFTDRASALDKAKNDFLEEIVLKLNSLMEVGEIIHFKDDLNLDRIYLWEDCVDSGCAESIKRCKSSSKGIESELHSYQLDIKGFGYTGLASEILSDYAYVLFRIIDIKGSAAIDKKIAELESELKALEDKEDDLESTALSIRDNIDDNEDEYDEEYLDTLDSEYEDANEKYLDAKRETEEVRRILKLLKKK